MKKALTRAAAALLAALLILCALPLSAAAQDDYALWQDKTRAALDADLSSCVSADSGSLAWGTSYLINAYCRAYQATGEEVYLRKAGGYLYEIFRLAEDNDGDGYKNWGTGHYSGDSYEEFAVHTGALLSSAGEWANLVLSSPKLLRKKEPTSGMTYQALVQYLVREATTQMIPAFDKDWNEKAGLYMSPAGSVYFEGKKVSLPNNQFLAMAAALLQFAKLSPEHADLYLGRAGAMLRAFRSKLNYSPCRGNITRWKYRDWYFCGDGSASTEDYSHGMWSVRAAIMGYANGLAFSQDNIAAFARVYKNITRGTKDEPLLAERVDGGGTKDNALFLFIYDLSPFGDSIWSTGYKTAVFRGTPASAGDAARILVYHEAAPAPLRFALLAPKNNAKAGGRTLFRWEPSVHACKYTLQVSGEADFSSLLTDRANILDTCAFVDGLPAGQTLYWRVIAGTQSGKTYTSEVFTALS